MAQCLQANGQGLKSSVPAKLTDTVDSSQGVLSNASSKTAGLQVIDTGRNSHIPVVDIVLIQPSTIGGSIASKERQSKD